MNHFDSSVIWFLLFEIGFLGKTLAQRTSSFRVTLSYVLRVTSSTPCFYPITNEIVSYLNGLRQQCNDPFYVFGSLAQMDVKQRNRLVSDYIKKSGVRLSIDLKYLHRFFGEYAYKSYFVPQFIACFIRGENTVAYSQKLARNALIEWWGEKTSIVVFNE